VDEQKEAAEKAYEALEQKGSMEEEFPNLEGKIPLSRIATVEKIREVVDNKVCWVITNGCEVLDRGEWHDSEFPFVAVLGKDEVVDGKREITGIIKHAKDSQKLANYMITNAVKKIDASNKTPWIIPEEAVPAASPARRDWETSHLVPKAALYYRSRDDLGNQIMPPQRGDSVEPAIQAILQAYQTLTNGIKQTVGIYEAGIGETVGERQSGNAIKTLAERGEINNFHFSDNLVMAIKRLGWLILRLIPKVYDTPRTVRIIGLDDEEDLIKVNEIFHENGQQKMHDLTAGGEYDVVIDTGPTFATKKAQESESMIGFLTAVPQLGPVLADLVAKNMDWDASGTVADRVMEWQVKNGLVSPPNGAMADLPPQAKAIIAQLQGQLQQVNQHVQQLNGAYQQEKYKNDTQAVAHASKERQQTIKAMSDLQLKKMDLAQEMLKDHNRTKVALIKSQLDHITNTQRVHLDALKLFDKESGQNDSELYNTLQQMVNSNGADPSAAGGVAPPGPSQVV